MLLSELSLLFTQHPSSSLHFILPSGRLLPQHAHLTEVAFLSKTFIDCGGEVRQQEFCSLQLWSTFDLHHRLKSDKFYSILQLSGKILPHTDLETLIEWQEQTTSLYAIDSAHSKPNIIEIHLSARKTDCLAKDRCGVA
ncbi:MAG: hypothetical protein HC904_14085 [Blastochloris sp.]|nr:hypothetical protein [Blastochloris sp.]